MVAWRNAKSIEQLRAQVNAKYPSRSKASDGTIGDANHASRASDHNPHCRRGADYVVTAIDITHDPKNGYNSYDHAEALRLSGDPRIKYIISCGKIANPGKPWRKYTGKNSHCHHMHVSVVCGALTDDTRPWAMPGAPATHAVAPVASAAVPVLRKGSKGTDVEKLQKKLGFTGKDVDGDFGPKTDKAVRAKQAACKIGVDGIVGGDTWKCLGGY